MQKTKLFMKYSLIRAFSKGKLIIYLLYAVFAAINIVTGFIQAKLGLSSQMLVPSSFEAIIAENISHYASLAIALLTLYHYTTELKNNQLSLLILSGRPMRFLFYDILFQWIFNLILLSFITTILVGLLGVFAGSLFILGEFFNLYITSVVYASLFYMIIGVTLSFSLKKYVASFFIVLALNMLESFLSIYLYVKNGIEIATFFPFSGSKKLFNLSSLFEIALNLCYLFSFIILCFYFVKRFYSKPYTVKQDASL